MKNSNTHQKENLITKVIHVEQNIEHKVKSYQDSAFHRFPFIFLALSTFGGVMIFYGFEKIIDQHSFLAHNPLGMLTLGFLILILTGAVYRKLG